MLYFICRGETFKVRPDGKMTQARYKDFSGEWEFLGVSFHHWRVGVDISFKNLADPSHLKNGLVWDVDHGTIRQWLGNYYGKLPRIIDAWIVEDENE